MSNKITPKMLEALRRDIDEALKAVGKKHGVELTSGRATYSDEHFSIKLEGKLEGALSAEAAAYDTNRELFKLPPRDTEITLRQQVFILRGLTPRGKVILERKQDGKEFTTSVTDVVTTVRLASGSKVS